MSSKNIIIRQFEMFNEKEEYDVVIDSLEKAVPFRGTNLWVLIFAILIASLGLNVNSTAVIIGAMLISPLMGPIMGIGLSLGINDLDLLRKSAWNYGFATIVGLITSTVYFLISPLNEAHSEILARTQPTIYDVLIAFFGGLAGVVASTSKLKGNVIPGVAIATALMPPLCTAGYGLATGTWNYFFGAFYLYLINGVFIALATWLTIKVLNFPVRHLLDVKAESRASRLIWLVTMLTILPSIYLGYVFIQADRFEQKADQFIANETKLPNEYLLNRKVDPHKKIVDLTFGGAKLTEEQLDTLQMKFEKYLFPEGSELVIHQGFAYLDENNMKANVTDERQRALIQAQQRLDSLQAFSNVTPQIYRELKINFPSVQSFSLQEHLFMRDTSQVSYPVAIIRSEPRLNNGNLTRLRNLLMLRLQEDTVIVIQQ